MFFEVKIQEGERMQDFEIDGYYEEAYLREDHSEGGIMIWIRINNGLNIQVKNSISSSEKVWLTIELLQQKIAMSQIYL